MHAYVWTKQVVLKMYTEILKGKVTKNHLSRLTRAWVNVDYHAVINTHMNIEKESSQVTAFITHKPSIRHTSHPLGTQAIHTLLNEEAKVVKICDKPDDQTNCNLLATEL